MGKIEEFLPPTPDYIAQAGVNIVGHAVDGISGAATDAVDGVMCAVNSAKSAVDRLIGIIPKSVDEIRKLPTK